MKYLPLAAGTLAGGALVMLLACTGPGEGEVEAAELAVVTEIEAILRAQSEDWSRGDIESFTSAYDEECLYLSPSGRVDGRAALTARYRERYPGREGMGTLRLEIIEMRPAYLVNRQFFGLLRSSDIGGVSVAARWHLSWPDRESDSGYTLLVFRHTPEGWRIVQDASM
jgi:hypothetical protein